MNHLDERKQTLKHLESTQYDILILGGGATGSGTALDASLRGYKVALLEKGDFSQGTSSRSTKLIHGGVRYLAQFHFKLIYEALSERKRLLINAPHLVKPLPFVLPTYVWWEKPFYSIGLTMYDILAGKSIVPGHERISKATALDYFASLKKENLKGGISYYDAQFNDARLNVTTIRAAKENGADIVSRIEVTSFLKDNNGKIIGVTAKDSLTKKVVSIKAKVVANTTGVWIDSLRKLDDPKAENVLAPSQGIHLVFDKEKLPCRTAMIIPKTADGRVVFVIPWEGKVLLGTTDTPIQKIEDEPLPLQSEVEFLLQTGNDYLDTKLTKDDIESVFSGLRPLISTGDKKDTKSISREEAILVSDSGLVTMSGGKWSTFRKMAEDLTDKLISVGNLPSKMNCVTASFAFPGADGYSKHLVAKIQTMYDLPYETAVRLVDSYGGEVPLILGKKPKEIKKGTGYFAEEIKHFVKKEFALSVSDVLSRRWRVVFLDLKLAESLAVPVSNVLGKELGWKETEKKSSLNELLKHIKDLKKTIS
ncbi:glycerol-3-phosphate dehydrogenase/oxidase [Leptospira levettii]|uniref:Glycerol-3-phosphate dehydrogenase/oxidase n=1 Tax=Leptospira levettii TaxID=2023178 RepID=A0AAW5V1D1_9LEPT|nr:glycerol-3-phosphate dehydrogenase/oxidase [Leptospira levettii]MCW7466669.1 glycerol-3-phosphate dehydrogenase/oxidase [Leptospira levettii]MCW7511765.1 glycerol-3-phosphate dehydrogenase/oxidase [Leptospira levettii]MCW7515525.1 glycerol-3-phosphate dehydrogenase/oxidase [Leptospira levettii]